MALSTMDEAKATSNTAQSSKKTDTTSHLITPPRSIEPSTPHTVSPSQSTSSPSTTTTVHNHISNAAMFITSTWIPQHDVASVPSLFSNNNNNNTMAVVSFTNYLTEILKRSRCSTSTLHGALFYINKLSSKIHDNNYKLLQSPKKVFLTCLILSFKFQYDSTYNLKAWSKISGLSVMELKQLEMGILKLLDYKVALNNDEYSKWLELITDYCYFNSIESGEVARVQTGKRQREDDYIQNMTVKKPSRVTCA